MLSWAKAKRYNVKTSNSDSTRAQVDPWKMVETPKKNKKHRFCWFEWCIFDSTIQPSWNHSTDKPKQQAPGWGRAWPRHCPTWPWQRLTSPRMWQGWGDRTFRWESLAVSNEASVVDQDLRSMKWGVDPRANLQVCPVFLEPAKPCRKANDTTRPVFHDERNGIYPAPITHTIAENSNHCSLCFGGKSITLGLRKASLFDTTRLCRDRGTVPITKNTTKGILAVLSIAFGRHEEFLGIIHSVPQLIVPNPQLLDLGSQPGSHPGIPIIPQKNILSKNQYSPYGHQSEQSLCYNFTNMAKEHLKSTLDDTISS